MENSFHGSSGLLTQICPKDFHKLPEGNFCNAVKIQVINLNLVEQENLIGSLLFPCLTPIEENMHKIFTQPKNIPMKPN